MAVEHPDDMITQDIPNTAGVQAPGPGHRRLFQIGCFFALWIWVWHFVLLGAVHRPVPFDMPPLHMRFIASLYFGGAVMMAIAARATRLADVRIATIVAGLFTLTLLLASLVNLGAFDLKVPDPFVRLQSSWWWFALYLSCPVIAGGLIWQTRSVPLGVSDPLPVVLRGLIALAGLGACGFAGLLAFMPGQAAAFWPWGLPELLAQIYAGPIATFGVAAVLIARSRDAGEGWGILAGIAGCAAMALLGSVLHLGVFTPGSVSMQIWFGVLTGVVCVFGVAARLGWQAVKER